MNTEQIIMCVVALILGMLLANMLKSVCGCKLVEGQNGTVSYKTAAPGTASQTIEDLEQPCIDECDRNFTFGTPAYQNCSNQCAEVAAAVYNIER